MGREYGVNQGVAYNVAHGKVDPPRDLLLRMGLPTESRVTVPDCKHCHQPHYRQIKRCPSLPKKARKPPTTITLSAERSRLVYALAHAGIGLMEFTVQQKRDIKELITYLETRLPNLPGETL